MDIYAAIGIAAVGAALAVIIKQYKPEYALAVSLSTGVVIMYIALKTVYPVLSDLDYILKATNMQSAYIEVLLKSLGICFITQLAADACRDSGQGAIAAKVEMAGKAAILVISMPLFRALLNLAMKIMGR